MRRKIYTVLYLVTEKEDVARLDVAVHYTFTMHVLYSL
jgi:hypothetical protein